MCVHSSISLAKRAQHILIDLFDGVKLSHVPAAAAAPGKQTDMQSEGAFGPVAALLQLGLVLSLRPNLIELLHACPPDKHQLHVRPLNQTRWQNIGLQHRAEHHHHHHHHYTLS